MANGASRGGAVVTGAGRGLGLEIAREASRRGFTVHVTDIDTAAAEAAAGEIGHGAIASALDVRDEEACRAAAATTRERLGSLKLWVNNAGVLVTGPAWEQPPAARRLMLDVNAHGTINGTLAAIDAMRPGGGHVVNVISLAGIVAAPGETVYGASKHAAIAFSIGTLADLRKSGIKDIDISCVCPDGIWTPMLEDKLDDPEAAASFSGQMLTAEQVAERIGRLLERPRPLLVIPRWRGVVLRLFDAFPRVALAGTGPTLRVARMQQRAMKRKVEAGRWPPAPRA